MNTSNRSERYEYISSRSNPLIIETAKLSDKKYREMNSLFTIEGVKLFREALARGCEPVCAFASEESAYLLDEIPSSYKTRRITVTESVYDKITNENSPQGIFCTLKYLDNLHNSATIYSSGFSKSVFIVSGVRDPGNLGTIMRSALAFGIDTLILSDDCADVYNARTVRASMGAVFSQKTLRTPDLIETIGLLKKSGYRVYSAALDKTAVSLSDFTPDEKTCFAVGNEGVGLSKETIDASDGKIYIPMLGNCESLNVAIASSVLMWESSKNRK